MRSMLLIVSFLLLVSIGGQAAAETASPWVAYEARTGSVASPLVGVVNTAPQIALFRDGRLIWLDVHQWRSGDGQNPCAWRTARLTHRERIDFRQILEHSEFFTIDLPPQTSGVDLPDGGRILVGGRSGSQRREVVLMSRYVPESEGSRRYVARVNEVSDALRALTQRVSECYRPDAIRVQAFKAQATGSVAAGAWPASVTPDLTGGRMVEYRGEEARKIIEALAVSSTVIIEGESYSAAWAPWIDVPFPAPPPAP